MFYHEPITTSIQKYRVLLFLSLYNIIRYLKNYINLPVNVTDILSFTIAKSFFSVVELNSGCDIWNSTGASIVLLKHTSLDVTLQPFSDRISFSAKRTWILKKIFLNLNYCLSTALCAIRKMCSTSANFEIVTSFWFAWIQS